MKRQETSQQTPRKKTSAMRMWPKETHRSQMEVAGPRATLQVLLEVPQLLKQGEHECH